MRKIRFLKCILVFFGIGLFSATGILASEPEGQAVPDSNSNLSPAVADSSTPILRGTETRRRRRIKKPEFFSGSLSLAEAYDDNILEYSSADLNLLKNNPDSTKFAIRTPGDYRTSFDLKIDLNPDLFRRNSTRLRFRFGADFFARNSVENYQLYGFDLKQNFFRKSYFQVGFKYIPHFYLRNLVYFDKVLLRPRYYVKATFSKQSYFFELGRKFSPSLAFSLGYGYEKTVYNSEFAERDSKATLFYGDLNLGIGKQVDVNIGYSHKDSKAKGADMVMLLIEDVSNKTDQFNFGFDFNLRKSLGIPLSFAPSYVYEYQKYTTYKIPDKYHHARRDKFYRISSELSYRWSRHFNQFLRYSYERNKTNLPETLSNPDVADYKANKISGGLTWFF